MEFSGKPPEIGGFFVLAGTADSSALKRVRNDNIVMTTAE